MSPRTIGHSLRRLFRRAEVNQELNDEVAQYLEHSVNEHMRSGLSRADAERAARLEFGGVENAKEAVRDFGWEGALDTLRRDLAYAVRGLRRNPGFTIVAVLTLALGIGANTAIFSVVNAVLLRPLPYRAPDRLALIYTDDVRRGLHEEATAFATIQDWRTSSRAFQGVAYFNAFRTALVEGLQQLERTRGSFVSGNLFSVLGVAPLRGRVISVVDEDAGDNIAVISYALWQRRYNGDPSAIGKTLQTDMAGKGDGIMRIVGVMPPGFYFPDKQTEFWTTSTSYWRFRRESAERFPSWARRWTAVARLASNVSLDDARVDLRRVSSRLTATYPGGGDDFPGFATNAIPILDHFAGRGLQSALWVLLASGTLVLLVACANVANLLLARGAARQREFAIRLAIGAARGRLVRQLVAESLVLALVGGTVGAFAATLGSKALGVLAARQIPRIDEITVDVRVLAFALAVSIVAGLVFGVIPALRVSQADPGEAMKDGAQPAGVFHVRRSRGLLVVAECALAIVLLAGAGLLLRSLSRLNSVNPGFDPKRVLSMRLELAPESPATADERAGGWEVSMRRAEGRAARFEQFVARLAALPGVESVGVVDDMFNTGRGNESITIPGHSSDSTMAGELNQGSVSSEFFHTMRVPLRRGRFLTAGDTRTKIHAMWHGVPTQLSLAEKERLAIAEPVVVNDAFVRRFYPGEDPIGKRFCTDPTNKTDWYTIVGVVGDMHRQGLERRTIPEYFTPYLPSPTARVDLVVRVRGDADPLALAPAVRQIVDAELPGTLVPTVATADRQLDEFAAERDFQTLLLSLFASLALALAAVGIYGVVHYTVAERTREIGVRIALGADVPEVIRLVVTGALKMPAIGISVGVAAALGLTRLMRHLLFETTTADPLTFGAVVALLFGAAVVASYVPARRASRIDPVSALRGE